MLCMISVSGCTAEKNKKQSAQKRRGSTSSSLFLCKFVDVIILSTSILYLIYVFLSIPLALYNKKDEENKFPVFILYVS